jgi:hypothetical protein
MRAAGYSTRAIAATLGADRNTITADLRLLGVGPPGGLVVALDGRETMPRLRSPQAIAAGAAKAAGIVQGADGGTPFAAGAIGAPALFSVCSARHH